MWLGFHFPLLPLDAHGAGVVETPSIVLNRRGNRVALANPAACHQGIKADMPLAQAFTLSPELQVYEVDPLAEQQLLDSLCQWLSQYSATVCQRGGNAIVIEVASMCRYFHGLATLISELQNTIPNFISGCDIGLAPTPLLALWRARSHLALWPQEDVKDLADLQTMAIETWLSNLPITAIGWSQQEVQRLSGLGIKSIIYLHKLPFSDLRRHLGESLYQDFGKAVGVIKDPQPLYVLPDQFERHVTFDREIEYSLGLLFPLRRIVEQLALFLRRHRWRLFDLSLTLKLAWHAEGQDEVVLLLRHDLGSDRAELWLELAELKLGKMLLPAPVRELTVVSGRWEASHEENADLFDDNRQRKADEAIFLSRLRARLGEQALSVAHFSGHHLPEMSGSYVPYHLKNSQPIPEERPEIHGPLLRAWRYQRPNWLLPQPQAVNIAEFTQLKVSERVVGHWWQKQPTETLQPYRRDYVIARSQDGRLAWLFRDDQGIWYLHGWFG
ncbi:DNA polymerase Y family protein [Maribrevibacterium harenarium]|uniref:DNA polymerase Y family protein n=1 Tax=Maribrevibacterium harenarium TaxID=2589817 RepID=A0A501X5B8_9GAMM|nr:DNA polymerase Y family protein [Maribrevibacterium harenarium]TPE55648.1 DNA polymerase Y family protein [Maribrevibacterium harenarium]